MPCHEAPHSPALTAARALQVYEPFYADFGPLNLGKAFRFCELASALVQVGWRSAGAALACLVGAVRPLTRCVGPAMHSQEAQKQGRCVYFYTGPSHQHKANAAVLVSVPAGCSGMAWHAWCTRVLRPYIACMAVRTDFLRHSQQICAAHTPGSGHSRAQQQRCAPGDPAPTSRHMRPPSTAPAPIFSPPPGRNALIPLNASQVGILQVLLMQRSAEEAWRVVAPLAPFPPFRDASCGISTFHLTVEHCIKASRHRD